MCLNEVIASTDTIVSQVNFRLCENKDGKYVLRPLYYGDQVYNKTRHIYKLPDASVKINDMYKAGYHAYGIPRA